MAVMAEAYAATYDGNMDKIEIVLKRSADGQWIASSPTVSGAHAQGDTVEEACANIGEALTLMLEDD